LHTIASIHLNGIIMMIHTLLSLMTQPGGLRRYFTSLSMLLIFYTYDTVFFHNNKLQVVDFLHGLDAQAPRLPRYVRQSKKRIRITLDEDDDHNVAPTNVAPWTLR
jgi:hypothetical protein